MKKIFYLLILFWAGFQTYAQVNGSISTQLTDWQLNQNGQYTDIQQITPPNSTITQIASLDSIGAPNLPVFVQNYVLPAGSTLTGVQIAPSQ